MRGVYGEGGVEGVSVAGQVEDYVFAAFEERVIDCVDGAEGGHWNWGWELRVGDVVFGLEVVVGVVLLRLVSIASLESGGAFVGYVPKGQMKEIWYKRRPCLQLYMFAPFA